MQPLLKLRRTGIVVLVAWFSCLLVGRLAWGVARNYTIDTSQSDIAVSGFLFDSEGGPRNITQQGTGSLTTDYSGTINTDRGTNTIQFLSGSTINANNSGNWSPTDTGAAGTAPASYGGRVTIVYDTGFLGITVDVPVDLATRSLAFGLTNSGSLAVAGNGSFPLTSTTLRTNSGSTIQYRGSALGQTAAGSEGIAGLTDLLVGSGTISPLELSPNAGFLREWLTIPITAQLIDTIPVDSNNTLTATLNFMGSLKAWADIVDPNQRFWIDPAGGTFATNTKWDAPVTPVTKDTAIFDLNNGTAYTVTVGTSTTNDRLRIEKDKVSFALGTRTYALASTSTTDPSVIVGADSGDAGELTLGGSSTGGFLSSINAMLGKSSSSTGKVTVNSLATWNNSKDLHVGNSGIGTLIINGGGKVIAPTGGRSYVGFATGSAGSNATIGGAGSGSTWTNDLLSVGHGANGTMVLNSSSTVNSVDATLGNNTSVTGTATVNSGGTWNNSEDLIIGRNGTGTLQITAGGKVLAPTGGNSYVGFATGSGSSTATVGGTGAIWTNHNLFVGHGANGAVVLNSGATLNSFDATLGNNASVTGQVTVNSGATWNSTDDLFIGNNGTGTLLINANGKVTTTIGGSYIGYGTGSNGSSATVTGASANWTNDYFFVGNNGSATLAINTGGVVTSKVAAIGSHATGGVTVGSAGGAGTFTNTDVLWVGEHAQGTMTIQNASALNTKTTNIGGYAGSNGTLTVTGSGSTWNNSGSVFVGGYFSASGNQGALNVNSSGSVTIVNTLKTYNLGAISLTSGKLKTSSLDIAQGSFSQSGGQLVATTVTGNLTRAGGSLTPGDSSTTGLTGVGQTSIIGNYTQQVGATLAIQLGETSIGQFDRLLTTGTANLAGTLAVSLVNSFVPAWGDSFQIMTFGSRTGTFGTHTLPGLGNVNLEWLTNYAATSLTLSVGLIGDFSGDGKVDAGDYVVWRNTGGTQTQYNNWRSHFGISASGSASSTSLDVVVPEPGTWALLVLGWIPFLGRGLRRRREA